LALGPVPYRKWVTPIRDLKQEFSLESIQQAKKLLRKADDFFWGHLLTYYGDVLTYLTGMPERRIVFILENARERLQKSVPSASTAWLRTRLLGRVHDRMGYLARTYGHYGQAAEHYRQALPYYEEAGAVEERATTLNNLAFVLAFMGDIQEARECADKAFTRRQQLGQRYPLALSRNTRGLIYALEDLEKGRQECQRALNIFEEIKAPRGIGLACNALGYILRKQGANKASDGSSPVAEQYFRQAEQLLRRAAEIFKDVVIEPVRLWEAYNEAGSLYFEWGNYLLAKGDEQQAEKKRLLAIEKHQMALEIAQRKMLLLQEIDAADDVAKVYISMHRFEEARAWLGKVRALIPDEYDFTKRRKGTRPPAGELLWLAIGKFWLQSGDWLLHSDQSDPMKKSQIALRYFLLAAESVQTYSIEYAALHWPEISSRLMNFDPKEVQQVYDELKGSFGIALDINPPNLTQTNCLA